ncbi:MAG TPA: nuclear transport factor 2 family protein [Candidatus Binataceae bacterium]|nr:nuclear transport factor 2 family protein [Candidatus Binataceae bacterium]
MKTLAAFVVMCAAAVIIGTAAYAGSDDTAAIKAVEQNFVAGVQAKNADRIMSNYQKSPDLIVFDLIPPRQYTGWDAYRTDWQGVLAGCKDAPAMEMNDLIVEGDKRYAYGHNIQHLTCTTTGGQKLDVTFRVTDAYKKIAGKWLIVHEHVSVPVDLETGKPDMNSKP